MDAAVELFMVFVGSIGGAAIGSFWKKKAEDWATGQSLANLTDIAKRVEAKITGEEWDRQKHWELRRDIMIEMARKASSEVEAMTALQGVYMTEKMNKEKGAAPRLDKRVEVGAKWNDAAAEFEGMQMVIAASCGKELLKALGNFGVFMREMSFEITSEKPEKFDAAAIAEKTNAISVAIRKELKLDAIA